MKLQEITTPRDLDTPAMTDIQSYLARRVQPYHSVHESVVSKYPDAHTDCTMDPRDLVLNGLEELKLRTKERKELQ